MAVSYPPFTLQPGCREGKNKNRTNGLDVLSRGVLHYDSIKGREAMAITADEAAEPRMQIGWVVRSSIDVMLARWLDLLVLGLPFIALPNLIVSALPRELQVLRLAAGLPGLVFIGGATLIAYRELAGEPRLTLVGAMSQGAQRFGTLWALEFVRGLATVAGLLAFVVPGVFLLAAWMPATAIVMVERKGSSESLGLAWELTKGSRWRIAGLMAIQFAAVAAVLLLLSLVAIVLTLALGTNAGAAVTTFTVGPTLTVALQAILTVTATATYVALRRGKEGAVGGLAEVFA